MIVENLKARIIIVIFSVVMAVLYVLPNFTTLPKDWWFRKDKLNYGLDIQGGAHLIYGVDVEGVLAEKASREARSIAGDFKSKNITVDSVTVSDDKKAIVINYSQASEQPKILKHLEEFYGTLLQVMDSSDHQITLHFLESRIVDYRQQIIRQAIEVIRNRVDEFGVAEPIIAAQGDDRILVQLPGLKDPARAKELINRTARLSFHIVTGWDGLPPQKTLEKLQGLIADAEKAGNYALGKDKMTYSQYFKRINEDLKGKIPDGTMVAFEKARNATDITVGKTPYLLLKDSDLGGDQLEDASVGPGDDGAPQVNFHFDPDGRRKFADSMATSIVKWRSFSTTSCNRRRIFKAASTAIRRESLSAAAIIRRL